MIDEKDLILVNKVSTGTNEKRTDILKPLQANGLLALVAIPLSYLLFEYLIQIYFLGPVSYTHLTLPTIYSV